MTYRIQDISAEINRILFDLQARKAPLVPKWIAAEMMKRHDAIEGTDAPFHTCAAHAFIREQARKQVNRFELKPEVEPDRQLILAGFERLQTYYVLEQSNGERIGVHIDHLTDEQIDMKCAELDAMAAGCSLHSDELRRLKATRQRAA